MKNGFNDFSSLKALKKELEKQEAPAAETAAPQRRPSTVVHKTKAQHAGEQKARELGLVPGSRVTLMDSNDRGILRHVHKDCVEIEIDGLMFKAGFGDFVVNDPEEDRQMLKGIGNARKKKMVEERPAVSSSNELTVDLHIERIPGGYDAPEGFELPFQLEYFKRVMRENLKHRGRRITLIHGVGDSILRDAVRKELDEVYALSCSWTPGDNGVTVVTIR